jgi:nickel/cobalt exporter
MADFLIPALLLGLKHSFDADHLLAVSTVLTRSGSLRKSATLAASWSLGHIGGAVVATSVLFFFRDSIAAVLLGHFETATAVMLIAFGLFGLYQALTLHSHRHGHGSGSHEHVHMHLRGREDDHAHAHIIGLGLVQGLASNDELLLLLTVFLGLAGLADMVGGVVVFSVGVFIGMLIFGFAFSLPLVRSRSLAVNRALNGVVGVASAAYGAWMLMGG